MIFYVIVNNTTNLTRSVHMSYINNIRISFLSLVKQTNGKINTKKVLNFDINNNIINIAQIAFYVFVS